MSINGRSFVVFRRFVEKKTVVSFRVLSSFETILRASSSESSSESSESSPTGSGLRDNVLCQNVVTFFMSKRKRKSRITFNLGYQKKKNILLVFPRCERKLQKKTPKQPHAHAHTRHMFAATNINKTTTTTSLFSSTRRHHQPSSSRRPHPFVCASSLKSSTRKQQQEKDDRNKTVKVDDVDRRDVLTKAALVASVAMTTMTPKPVRAHFL